ARSTVGVPAAWGFAGRSPPTGCAATAGWASPSACPSGPLSGLGSDCTAARAAVGLPSDPQPMPMASVRVRPIPRANEQEARGARTRFERGVQLWKTSEDARCIGRTVPPAPGAASLGSPGAPVTHKPREPGRERAALALHRAGAGESELDLNRRATA